MTTPRHKLWPLWIGLAIVCLGTAGFVIRAGYALHQAPVGHLGGTILTYDIDVAHAYEDNRQDVSPQR